ncbi:MAG: nitroreductase family protein, partial [Syntrophorhabdales bacterium]
MDYEGFLELIKARRSTRRFKPDPVPDEYIDRIVEAG